MPDRKKSQVLLNRSELDDKSSHDTQVLTKKGHGKSAIVIEDQNTNETNERLPQLNNLLTHKKERASEPTIKLSKLYINSVLLELSKNKKYMIPDISGDQNMIDSMKKAKELIKRRAKKNRKI